ncbi:hypothetical protein [Moorena sp. SIO4A5]|uniref:hypothetical protein n=1 Tax=Moorena sp. SIO4A5 TaxID=2607838 RepID=UPI0013CBD17A|nr:hypothetical protein [Moorena sp. SIO4A5]NEO24882.1 hypothetical protein [Moorena sp. SIO4A5]
MTKNRGKDGRFVKGASGGRDSNFTFRVTLDNKQRLMEIANNRGLSCADLLSEWISSGCPTVQEVSFRKLKQKLVNVFISRFANKRRVGEQSLVCKDARKSLLMAIKEVLSEE